MNRTRIVATFAVLLLLSCPQAAPPSLSLIARPSQIDAMGQVSTISVTALDGAGMAGTGSVKITSAAGSLTSPVTLTLDAAGAASTDFSCDAALDSKCTGRVLVSGEWTSREGTATAEARVTIGGSGAGGGSGTGGGTGGGATGGGTGGGATGGGTGGGATGGGTGGGATGGGTGGGATGGGTGGGATGGGTGGGTPSPDAGVTFVGDAGEVYLIGVVTEGMQGRRLLARVTAPNQPMTAFNDIGFDPTKVMLGADGRLLYIDTLNRQLMAYVMDSWQRVGASWAYPADGGANDTVLPTPMCNAGTLSDFWVRPDTGGVVYRCGAALDYYEGTTLIPALTDLSLIALGNGGAALARDNMLAGVTVDSAGALHTITGLTRSLVGVRYEVRATATGFNIALPASAASTAPCESWSITFAGAATMSGTFATLPGTVTMQFGCGLYIGRIDNSGALYSVAQEGAFSVIYRRPVGGAATRVYSETMGFAPNFTTTPPQVFTYFNMPSAIVTGP